METIRSRQNPLVQQVRRLLERPRERQQAGLAVLDGDHLVNDWLSAGRAFERVLLAESRATEAAAWLTRGTAVALLADTCFEAVSPVASPTGIVALAPIPIATPVDRGLILALDAVQDPGNVGTLMRMAAAAAVDQVWLGAACADAWSWKVLRAAQGAHAVLPICERVDLHAAVKRFAGRSTALLPRADVPLYAADLRGDLLLLVGGEGAGLSAELIAAATVSLSIPMPGRAESLNAAMAGSIALYERVRQDAASA